MKLESIRSLIHMFSRVRHWWENFVLCIRIYTILYNLYGKSISMKMFLYHYTLSSFFLYRCHFLYDLSFLNIWHIQIELMFFSAIFFFGILRISFQQDFFFNFLELNRNLSYFLSNFQFYIFLCKIIRIVNVERECEAVKNDIITRFRESFFAEKSVKIWFDKCKTVYWITHMILINITDL